ncbi:MAG: phage holin family protein [Acidobacteriota bacterium]
MRRRRPRARAVPPSCSQSACHRCDGRVRPAAGPKCPEDGSLEVRTGADARTRLRRPAPGSENPSGGTPAGCLSTASGRSEYSVSRRRAPALQEGVLTLSRFLAHWIITAAGLGVSAWILPGVHVRSVSALLVAGLVLGFVNAIIRPILFLLTLPITILTLGLFYLVVNGLAFGVAAALVPGFEIDSIGWAVLGALVVSLVSWFSGWFVSSAPGTRSDRQA